jgi:hypothetical protein
VSVPEVLFRKEWHMASLFDRLNQELETFGKRAQAALDEGRSQIEVMRVRRQRDAVARDLGLFVYRRDRNGESDVQRFDGLMLRLDDLESQIRVLEREMAAARGEPIPAEPAPPPPAETEPVTTV